MPRAPRRSGITCCSANNCNCNSNCNWPRRSASNLQRNIQQLESRRSRLLLEKDNLPGADSGALQQAQQQVAELEKERAEQVEKLAHLQEQLPLADTQRRNQRDSLQQQERMLAQTEARLHALQQLQRADRQRQEPECLAATASIG